MSKIHGKLQWCCVKYQVYFEVRLSPVHTSGECDANASAILAKWSVKENGLNLSTDGGLVLGIETTIARFHSFETFPCCREEFNREFMDDSCRNTVGPIGGLLANLRHCLVNFPRKHCLARGGRWKVPYARSAFKSRGFRSDNIDVNSSLMVLAILE